MGEACWEKRRGFIARVCGNFGENQKIGGLEPTESTRRTDAPILPTDTEPPPSAIGPSVSPITDISFSITQINSDLLYSLVEKSHLTLFTSQLHNQ